MAERVRRRLVTDRSRSGRTLGSEAKRAELSLAPTAQQAAVRCAPWLSFNAVQLPTVTSELGLSLGPNRFLLGANLPWIRYGLDVGCSSVTPEGGLHVDVASAALLDASLARLRRDGVEYARVFLFCDGRAGIRFAADGTPEGLDGAVFPDVDVLLATAERHRIGLSLVLFDAGLAAAPRVVDGVSCGGHADVLSEPAKRAALLERVVEPLLERYRAHPAVDAWDIFDEPECATAQMHCPRPAPSSRWRFGAAAWSRVLRALGLSRAGVPEETLVEVSAMRSFLASAVEAIHSRTQALATVGLASTANFPLVQGLGLDFYQAHWWESYGDAALRRAASDFGLDRPLVLGAFPTLTQHKSVKTVLDTARCAGYGGALVWSLRADDGRGTEDGQLASWVRNHATQLYRRPARVETVPELAAVEPLAPLQLPPEAVLSAPATSDGDDEDDKPRAARSSEPQLPGLAASPS